MFKRIRKLLGIAPTFVDVVKITRRVGEDEILEVSFNGSGPETIAKTGDWLDFLYGRVADHNRRVLEMQATVGGARPENILQRVQ